MVEKIKNSLLDPDFAALTRRTFMPSAVARIGASYREWAYVFVFEKAK